MQEWDAEFFDEEDDSLQEEFGAALDESIAQRLSEAGLDDTEVLPGCPAPARCPAAQPLPGSMSVPVQSTVQTLFGETQACTCCVLQQGFGVWEEDRDDEDEADMRSQPQLQRMTAGSTAARLVQRAGTGARESGGARDSSADADDLDSLLQLWQEQEQGKAP